MENLIDELNDFTNNEYKFMLKSALLKQDADFCVIEILYKDGMIMSKQKKDEFVEFCLKGLPKQFKYDIVFVKNFISEERIENDFVEFMAKTFPSMSYKLTSLKLENSVFKLEIEIDNADFDLDVTILEAEEFENVFDAKATVEILPGKEIDVHLVYDDDKCNGYLKIPFVGKIKIKDAVKI